MKFRLSSEFGVMEEVRNGRIHNGIDLAMPEGTTLRAIGDGVVDRVFDGDSNIGEGLSIRLEDGTRAIYGHMSDVDVNIGDKVNVGDVLGESGSTGLSTGPHLHFSLRDGKTGEWIDPTPIADELASMSGNLETVEKIPWWDISAQLSNHIREQAAEKTEQVIYGVFDALGEILFDSIYAIGLIGGGILILLKVAGYKDGYRWAGVLFAVNALVRYLFGAGGS